ncbi:hypothetical protein GALL_167770 [mine drainage metagenome]|uniref:DUF1349 domain-containing protein n=1 Tax=mine drainage metagenome TaxID=410659 RepID=A0A1J5SAS0_9ZZZZ
MKKILLIFLIRSSFSLHAQEINISSIPYPMHFENTAKEFKVLGENKIEIVAPAYTDLFIVQDGSYKTNKSPRLLFKPKADFILTAKIKPGFKSKWDAGVLMIFNDSTHFVKFCFENDFKMQPRVVSVVCNEVADDCNSMPINSKEIYFRIAGSVNENTFALYYSETGKDWFPIRGFRLNKTDNLQIGFSAQSPAGNGCAVEFSEINLQERKLRDFWKGE